MALAFTYNNKTNAFTTSINKINTKLSTIK